VPHICIVLANVIALVVALVRTITVVDVRVASAIVNC
jgi:hypothetical protein